MTYVDLIIGIVSAHVILGLLTSVHEALCNFIGNKLISEKYKRYQGDHFTNFLDIYKTWLLNKEYLSIVGSIPNNYSSGGASIIKKDDYYEFTDVGSTHPSILTEFDIYNEIKYNHVRKSIGRLLNEYKKSQQFKQEMKDIINND